MIRVVTHCRGCGVLHVTQVPDLSISKSGKVFMSTDPKDTTVDATPEDTGPPTSVDGPGNTCAKNPPPIGSSDANESGADWPPADLADDMPTNPEDQVEVEETDDGEAEELNTLAEFCAGTDAIAPTSSEGTATADKPIVESGPDKSAMPLPAIDAETVLAELNQCRRRLVDGLFSAREAAVEVVAQAYAALWQQSLAAGLPSTDDGEKLLAAVLERHQRVVDEDRAEMERTTRLAEGQIEVNARLCSALDTLVGDLAALVQGLDDNSAEFTPDEESLQVAIANHRKGLEIIQRMFGRARDRRKDLSSGRPSATIESFGEATAPGDAGQLSDFVKAIWDRLQVSRESRDQAILAWRDFSETCRKGVGALAKALLPAIDGVDSGLAGEATARTQWLTVEGQSADRLSLVERCFSSYARLNERVDRFLDEAGLEARTVVPGVSFDPETMEPVGTVERPDLPNDAVASVARRGFALAGETLRPVAVEVVRNG